MVSGFICGTSVLPRDEDDEHERQTRSADSSPRKSRSKSNNHNKNPYSTRGLDKFSALLSEIEEKRQQIYSQVDPHEISLVRFVYTNDHEFKPIVVKAKPKGIDHQAEKQPKTYMGHKSPPSTILSSSSSMATKEVKNDTRNEMTMTMTTMKKKKEKMNFYKRLWVNCSWVEPKIYLPMIIILILVILLVFGKSFAIMCTSIGWYIIPSIMNSSNSSLSLRTSFKKKDFAMRRLSNKKLVLSEGAKSFKHPHQERVYGGQKST